MALQPLLEELDTKVPYGLLQAISVGLGDVVSDMLQKTLDNVSRNSHYDRKYFVLAVTVVNGESSENDCLVHVVIQAVKGLHGIKEEVRVV